MSEHDCELHHHHDRTWIEVGDEALEALNASGGDVIVITLHMAHAGEGPPEPLEVVGILGQGAPKKRDPSKPPSKPRKDGKPRKSPPKLQTRKIWLVDHVDVDRVVAVTLKRRRVV